MSTIDIIRSQYLAALEMLNQAILQCPEELWEDARFPNQFWQIAYHVLFYTHLYLQPAEEDFLPWEKHKQDYHSFEGLTEAVPDPQNISPYTKPELLEYLEFCRREVNLQVESLDLRPNLVFTGCLSIRWSSSFTTSAICSITPVISASDWEAMLTYIFAG